MPSEYKSVQSSPWLDQNSRVVNNLTLEGCQGILASYKSGDQHSSLKKWISGASYKGEHSTNTIRDLLAGGSTNNFFFKHYRRSAYANIAKLIDEIICQNEPEVALNILKEFDRAKSLVEIQKFVEKYHEKHLTSKCYYDLQQDFSYSIHRQLNVVDDKFDLDADNIISRTQLDIPQEDEETKKESPEYTTNNHHLARQRAAEAESHRLSKTLCMGYAICQGFIEMMGMMAFPFFAGITAPWSGVALTTVFLIAYYINYVFPREDTAQLILRWKLGTLFKRTKGFTNEGNPKFESYSPSEVATVIMFAGFSLTTALCIFGLGVSSLLGWPIIPLSIAYIAPLVLVMPASLIFTNMVHKFIDKEGVEDVKNYYDQHLKPHNWLDIVKIPFKLLQLSLSLIISATVACATFLMLQSKAFLLLSCVFSKNTAIILSNIAAGVTAGVKALFSVSKINHLCESFIAFVFNRKKPAALLVESENVTDPDDQSTIKMFNQLRRKNKRITFFNNMFKLAAVGGHSVAEGGLVLSSVHNKAVALAAQNKPPMNVIKTYVLAGSKSIYSAVTTSLPLIEHEGMQNNYEAKSKPQTPSPAKKI